MHYTEDAIPAYADEDDSVHCQWFALCPNDATTTTPHPILGNVPTCETCNRFATS